MLFCDVISKEFTFFIIFIATISTIINDINPTGMSDMGKIMKEASSKLKGKADMSFVSSLIKEKLSQI